MDPPSGILLDSSIGPEDIDPAAMVFRVMHSYNELGTEYQDRRQPGADTDLLYELVDKIPKNGRILDAGCGSGDPVTEILSENSGYIVGVDFSKVQLNFARENVPSADLICQEITTLDLPENFFDAITMYYSLFNIPREKHDLVFEKFFSATKPGGYILFNAGRDDDVLKYNENWLGTGIEMFWSRYDLDTYLEMLENLGYSIVWVKNVSHELTYDHEREHPFVLAKKEVSP